MIFKGDIIIDFLNGTGTDYKGRKFLEILTWDDKQLEKCHDQIQWIFPLHEDSNYAISYPIVDKELIEKINGDENIKNNLRKAKDRFEMFFGIGDYEDISTQKNWCINYNHNLLRITRIIRCLRLFVLEDEAKDFYDKVYYVGNKLNISSITLKYWKRALLEDIWESLR